MPHRNMRFFNERNNMNWNYTIQKENDVIILKNNNVPKTDYVVLDICEKTKYVKVKELFTDIPCTFQFARIDNIEEFLKNS